MVFEMAKGSVQGIEPMEWTKEKEGQDPEVKNR
jgi:hypothetical protein